MSTARPPVPGSTRTCPHCKASILESAAVCPACRHHLRFDPNPVRAPVASREAFRVEGTLRPPEGADAAEYSVVVSVKNARGQELSRQVVGLGALPPSEERTFTLSVEVSSVESRAPAGKPDLDRLRSPTARRVS